MSAPEASTGIKRRPPPARGGRGAFSLILMLAALVCGGGYVGFLLRDPLFEGVQGLIGLEQKRGPAPVKAAPVEMN